MPIPTPARPGPLDGGSIRYLFLSVFDLPEMLAFYREALGFEVYFEQEGACAFLRLGPGGTPAIALYAGRESSGGQANHWFWTIDVPDVDRTVAGLRARGVEVSEVKAVPFGRSARLTDPEGNVLEVHQPTGRSDD